MQRILVLGALMFLSACSDKSAAPPAPDSAATRAEAPAAPGTSGASQTAPAPAPSPVPNPVPALNVLSAEGIGAIRFGMKLAEAEQVAGKATLPGSFDPACSMVRFASMPKLRFMVENGVVTRADAEAAVESSIGVAIGDTLAQVRSRHPQAQVSKHEYDQNGHYVTFPTADGRAAIVLEESGGKVTEMRAGLQPAVAYVERCG